MYLFLFLLMPLSFAVYCLIVKNKKVIIPAVIGFLAAVLVCGIKLFFMYSHRIVPYSFSGNLIYFLLRQSLLPVVILYGLFFAVSRDEIDYKINSFLPLLLCFYMVYLPYVIISSSSAIVPGFLIFAKPLIYLAMISGTSAALKNILRFLREKKYFLVVLCVLLIIVYLVFPSIIESLYMTGTNILIIIMVSVIYCLIPVLYGVYKLIPFLKSELNL